MLGRSPALRAMGEAMYPEGGGRVVFWSKREAPEFGARGFPPPLEQDGVVVLVEDGDSIGIEEYSAAIVAELAHSKQVVFEGGHDLCFLDWERG